MKTIKYILFSIIMLIITFFIGILSCIFYIFPHSRENAKESLIRLRFIWEVIFRYFAQLLGGSKSNIKSNIKKYNFKGKIGRLKNSVNMYVDTDDFGLMFILIYDSIILLFWAYVLICTIASALVYSTVYYSSETIITTDQPKVEYEYIPTDIDKQIEDFCPCSPDYEVSLESVGRKIALIDSKTGEIQFSNNILLSDYSQMKERKNTKIKQIKLSGTNVSFFIGDFSIKLNYLQGFQLLDEPFFIYAINENGQLIAAEASKLTFSKE